jgi:hypothetical protein
LQEEGQPTQLSQEEDFLRRGIVSKSYDASEPIGKIVTTE